MLLLCVYCGAYFAIVDPGGIPVSDDPGRTILDKSFEFHVEYYRCGGQVAAVVFWPAEQIDRRLRPITWGMGAT